MTGGGLSTPGGAVLVTGAGSSYTSTIAQSIQAGSHWMVTNGGTVSSDVYFDVSGADFADIQVNGVGSTFSSGSSLSLWGNGSGSQANVRLEYNATGIFTGGFSLANTANSRGELTVVYQATATSGGAISVGTVVGSFGEVNVLNSGSWTHNGAGTIEVGATSGTEVTGTIDISSASFTTGTGATHINRWGELNVTNSTFTARGNINVAGGKLILSNPNFTMNAGRTLSVSAGGLLESRSAFNFNSAANITLSGAGTELLVPDGEGRNLSFGGGSIINVNSGAEISMDGFSNRVNIGSGIGGATLNLDGTNSRLSSLSQIFIGGDGGVGNVSVSNNASIFSNLFLHLGGDIGGAGSGGSLSLLSGGTVQTSSVFVGNQTQGTTSTLNISGANSVYTAVFLSSVGVNGGGSGLVNVGSGGRFNAGGLHLGVAPNGSIQVASGGTLSAEGVVYINGGTINIASGGNLELPLADSIEVTGGGSLTHGGIVSINTQKSVEVTGSGSQISMPAVTLTLGTGTVSVTQGGTLTLGTLIQAGSPSGSSLAVSGEGSSLNVFPSSVFRIGNVAASISDNATASLGQFQIDPTSLGFSGVTGTFTVSSGADVSSRSVSLGLGNTSITPSTGSLLVTGSGSTFTVDGGGVTIGGVDFESTRGNLTVQNGGVFTGPTGHGTQINPMGSLNIEGGSAIFRSSLNRNGGALNFSSGTLQIVDNFAVATGGLLGSNLTLGHSMNFITSGTTTLQPGGQLILNGGSFATGGLVNSGGALAFNSGSFSITGSGGLALQSGGALGSSLTLADGKNFNVSATTAIAAGASLRVNGGTFTGGNLLIAANGTARIDYGGASVGTIGNSGRIFVADTLQVSSSFVNQAGGRVTLEAGSGQIFGDGSFTNAGIVTGDGTISTAFTNAIGGEVRAESGKTLTFTSDAISGGRLNLLGGTLQFTESFTNAAGGEINGQGVLCFSNSQVPSSADPSAGLNNSGNMNFSGGDSQVYGTVSMLPGSRLIVSGGATATFFDVFRHNGLEVKASANSSVVFFDEVRGAGNFTGGGTLYMEGGYSPGNSPASVNVNATLVFSPSNTLTLEVGGTQQGTEYDHLDFGTAGSFIAGGTLVFDYFGEFVPEVGQVFDFFDFEPGQVSGNFDQIIVNGNFTPGMSLDTSNLLTSGFVTVIPEPASGLLLLGGLATAITRRRRH